MMTAEIKNILNRIILVIICLVIILSDSAKAENPEIKSTDSVVPKTHYQLAQGKIGFNFGFHFPYSGGIEISCLFSELVDVNFGFGLGVSGAKAGFGSRYFPLRRSNFSPMLGAYVFTSSASLSSGVKKEGREEVVYQFPSRGGLLINCGFRARFGKGNYFILGLGYTFPLSPEKPQLMHGSEYPGSQGNLDTYKIGGFSMDCGILIKVNRGSYKRDSRSSR